MSNATVKAAEDYIIEGLKNKNLSKVPLDENVVFQGPLQEKPLHGVAALREYLSPIFPMIKDCRIKKHVANGDEVCTMWDLETTEPNAVIPILEYFRLSGGRLVEIRPHYDPRPLVGPR
jgi:hypothetical protein